MELKVSKDDIVQQVRIIDIAEEEGVILHDISSGGFDFRCKCPNKDHKGGDENTPSCYINSQTNVFKCFACGASTNVIDFYMLCKNIDQANFKEAFDVLAERVTDPSGDGYYVPPVDNFLIMLDISKMIRKYILTYPGDLKWINSVMQKVAKYSEKIDKHDLDKAQELRDSLYSSIRERLK